jgi:peptidyl-prolyl cis-trans isomerase D
MENSRELVRWAYNAEKGDVSKVFELGSKYVVAILVSIKEKGTLPLDEVKEQVEIEAKKVKKAEQMMAKLEAGMKGCTMLDQVADKTKLVVEPANGQNFGNPSLPSAGREPQLYGRITSLKKGALYGPFKGENGVYVVQLDEKVPAPEIKELKPIVDQLTPSLAGRVDYAMFEALKEKSDIKDNRINFY